MAESKTPDQSKTLEMRVAELEESFRKSTSPKTR